MAVISKGIYIAYGVGGYGEGQFLNILEIPDLGGEVEAIEITTLGDSAHVYTDGLANYGDSLDFKMLYNSSEFKELSEIEGEKTWRVFFPDNMMCSFKATSSVKLDGVGVNSALTYTLSLKPCSEFTWY